MNIKKTMEWWLTLAAFAGVVGLFVPVSAQAEYADVVINNYADAAGMRPVVFPDWAAKTLGADL